MFLARIIRATNTTHYSIIRINWVTKLFVGGDILCFLIQAAGGGILTGSDSKTSADLGKGVILVGLCLQMVIFGFFMFVAAVWQRRTRGAKDSRIMSFNWPIYVYMLYIVSILITIRNLFRVIEYAMGCKFISPSCLVKVTEILQPRRTFSQTSGPSTSSTQH